jgi:hypothetical protein
VIAVAVPIVILVALRPPEIVMQIPPVAGHVPPQTLYLTVNVADAVPVVAALEGSTAVFQSVQATPILPIVAKILMYVTAGIAPVVLRLRRFQPDAADEKGCKTKCSNPPCFDVHSHRVSFLKTGLSGWALKYQTLLRYAAAPGA